MKKIMLILLAFLLCGCSLAFDPAGKLSAKKALPTGTTTAVTPMLQVNQIAALPTATARCKVTGDLHLRAAPNASAAVVDYLHIGDVVASNGIYAGWRSVTSLTGAAGYANARWLNCGAGR